MLYIRMAGTIPDVVPRWLHGAASTICGPAATGSAFSVGPLLAVDTSDAAAARPPADASATVTTWRLGWLDDGASPRAWPPAEAHFGSRALPVVGSEVERRSYAELARAVPARRVRLTMTTPTFFVREGRHLPLPDPALAVGGLVTRWNSYAPGPLRIRADDAKALTDAVFLDGVWGASAEVELGHGLRQTGFVGQAELRLLSGTTDYTATMFTALARFAGYAGLGARTAHGFGATDVDVLVDEPMTTAPLERYRLDAAAPAAPHRVTTPAPRRPLGAVVPPSASAAR
jgi:CRISPR-associated endoribonuclease Cas6